MNKNGTIDAGSRKILAPSGLLTSEHIILNSAGHWQDFSVLVHKPPLEINEFALPVHMINLNLAGRTRFWLKRAGCVTEGTSIPGDMTIAPALLPQEIHMDSSTKVLTIYFLPEFVERIAEEVFSARARRVELISVPHSCDLQVELLGHALIAEVEAGYPNARLFGELLASALAVHLLQNYSNTQTHPLELKGGLPSQKLRCITNYINENLERDMSLSEIAEVAGVSYYHFGRMFKRSTGVTPHQYILMLRVERAKKLLANTDLAIAAIAQKLGFADHSHFTAIFRKFVGVTPRKFRVVS